MNTTAEIDSALQQAVQDYERRVERGLEIHAQRPGDEEVADKLVTRIHQLALLGHARAAQVRAGHQVPGYLVEARAEVDLAPYGLPYTLVPAGRHQRGRREVTVEEIAWGLPVDMQTAQQLDREAAEAKRRRQTA